MPKHLFGNFPAGLAGFGLFLLRVITALALGYSGYSLAEQAASASVISFWRLLSNLLPLIGLLMIFGLATMVTGILSCALLLISFDWQNPRSNCISAVAAGLSLVMMLLGPGAYSLDARFFGWRRIEITRHPPQPKP